MGSDAIHFLNDAERSALRRIERGAIIRSAIAGALSGGACAITEVMAQPLVPEHTPIFSANSLLFWGLLGSVTLVASVLELAFLYWDTLRSVHDLASEAGLPLSTHDRSKSNDELVATLARAALELPNPLGSPWASTRIAMPRAQACSPRRSCTKRRWG